MNKPKTDLRTVNVVTDPSEFYPLAGLERLWKDVVEQDVIQRQRWKYKGVTTTGAGIFYVWELQTDSPYYLAPRRYAILRERLRNDMLAPGWQYREATKGTSWL